LFTLFSLQNCRLARCLPVIGDRADRGQGQYACSDLMQRAATVRYYLGRGRRAREAGRFEAACSNARRAIDANPGNPWAHALLGQCLMRQQCRDLVEARRAFERACALDPANGYFVRLLLEVLDAQGDTGAREDVLAWAWWSGAPVDRWLPDGPTNRDAVNLATSDAPQSEAVQGRRVPSAGARERESAWQPERVLV